MKKLLKSEICESVNSAGYTVHRGKVNKCGLKKKKKENVEEAKRGRDKLDPNWHLVSIGLCQKYYNKKGLRN